MTKYGLELFLEKSNLLDKHPEIFGTDRKKSCTQFLNKFKKYTDQMNKLNDITKFANQLKKEYSADDQDAEPIELAEWNEEYFNFEVSGKKPLNKIWVFPSNANNRKLKLSLKFYVNCIKLTDADPTTIKLANRNGHMMITGEASDSNRELGIGITYKMLILHNADNGWIVSPFKMVSQTEPGVNCSVFGKAATNNDIQLQFNTWKYGLRNLGKDIGIVNYKYLNKKYRDYPNLFTPQQSNELLIEAKKINRGDSGNSGNKSFKKFNNKKSFKKKSFKKFNNKKSFKKRSFKKKSFKKK